MKVALVHDHLYQLGGAEKVLLNLHRLFPNSPVYTLIYDQRKLPEAFSEMHVIPSVLQKLPFAKSIFKWYLIFMSRAIEQFDFSEYDVVISNASSFAKGIRVPKGTIHICYCHTPTRYLWNFSQDYLKEQPAPKILKSLLPPFLDTIRKWDYEAAQRVDYFIANSHAVADRIKKYYNRDAVVINPPVATDKFAISNKVEDYYVLFSRLRPYKKVDIAVQAFNKLNMPLKILGSGEEEQYLRSIAGETIEFLGAVSDKERKHYLSHARALIHPQIEDFGIIAVESLASGRPVIAYQGGGAVEILEDGVTGVFFKEQKWESLAEAVIRFDHTRFDPYFLQKQALAFDEGIFKQKIHDFVQQIAL